MSTTTKSRFEEDVGGAERTVARPVAVVIGASRGIGRQVAIDLGKNGYRVVVAAKTISSPRFEKAGKGIPPPNSKESSITTVAAEIISSGGHALALPLDVRDPASVKDLIDKVVKIWGSLDVLVYNAGAIWWGSVEETSWKRFKLMQEVNVEGLYAVIQASLPYWRDSGWKARVIVVSPPIYSRFFRGKTAYAMGKVGMSVLTKGLAMDWARQGRQDMAITSIWPAASIESAATTQYTDKESEHVADLRKPTIFSDAILAMLQAPATEVSGLIDTDEDFLRRKGMTDFSKYSVVPGKMPRRIMPRQFPVLEVPEQDDEGTQMSSVDLRRKESRL